MEKPLRTCLAMLAILPLLAACAGNPALHDGAAFMHSSATKAESQTADMFRTASAESRAVDIERKLMADERDKPAIARLSEADFPQLVEPSTARNWAAMFAALRAYTGALARLTDPDLAASVGTGLASVSAAVGSLADTPAMQGPLASLLRDFGTAVARAETERKALTVIRATDPAFGELVTGMAEALGDGDTTGLRGTVADRWNAAALRSLSERYAELTRANPSAVAERRDLASRYIGGLEARDAQQAEIAAIRARLLALAQTHHDLASLKQE